MRLPRWLAEPEEVPDPWAEAARVVREELARREEERRRNLPPEPLRGLSRDAAMVLAFLHEAESGRTYLERLRALIPGPVFDRGFTELLDAHLVDVRPATDEDGQWVELIVDLRYDIDLPGTEPSDG